MSASERILGRLSIAPYPLVSIRKVKKRDSLGRIYGVVRYLPDIICPCCKKTYRPNNHLRKFCSRKCQWEFRETRECFESYFLERVKKSDGDSCWEWVGIIPEKRYGVAWRRGKPIGAHRASWELAHGKISSSKMFVCHKCDNPACVRIDHLFLGTNSDNIKDAIKKGRYVSNLVGIKFCLNRDSKGRYVSNVST